jgi:hypothetical protein
MAAGTFTLADRLGAKTVPCRVSGCVRTWLQLSNKALALGGGAVAPDDPSAGMCEPCRNKLRSVRDVERHCERAGCTGTWTWPALAQVEAFATRRPPPRGLCAEDQAKLASLETKEVPCSSPGCTRVAVLSPRDQLMTPAPEAAPAAEAAQESAGETPASEPAGNNKKGGEPRRGATITGPLCSECERVVPKLRDRPVNCGIAGCNRKWFWRADEQLQYFLADRPPDPPPRRMCDECRANFGKLLDREVRCRTSGCKKTWTWARGDQLDACVAGKAPPKAPARMCESCFDTFSALKDVERPCRRGGCKGTWLDKRGAQLARAVRGKTGDPYPRYCSDCEKELGDLEDREVPCKTENCPGTHTWTKEQQLAAGVRPQKMLDLEQAEATAQAEAESAAAAAPEVAEISPDGQVVVKDQAAQPGAPGKRDRKRKNRKRRREIQPPERRCSACAEFLAAHKTLEIPCATCATPIYWPPESQLQTHLGNWAMPTICGACKRDATEAARKVAKEAIRDQMNAQAAEGTALHEAAAAAVASETPPAEPAPTEPPS